MATVEQLQEIIDLIRDLVKTIMTKRGELWRNREIPQVEWPLTNEVKMLDFIERLADKKSYSNAQKMTVFQEIQKVLNQSSSRPVTVSYLESKLIDLQNDLNLTLLNQLLTDISDFETKIANATGRLQEAIDELNNLNEIFGAITLAVSIIAAVGSAAVGNFSLLTGLVGDLI